MPIRASCHFKVPNKGGASRTATNANSRRVAIARVATFSMPRVSYRSRVHWMMSSPLRRPRTPTVLSPYDLTLDPIPTLPTLLYLLRKTASLFFKLIWRVPSNLRGHICSVEFVLFRNIPTRPSCPASLTSPSILGLWGFDVPNCFQPPAPHERRRALAKIGCRKKQAKIER